MKVLSTILFVLTSLLLISCGTTPVTINKAKPIKAINQFKYSNKTSKRNALLSLLRNEGLLGSMCETRVFIDGHKVGEVGSGRIIRIYLKPGKHKVGIVPNNTYICGGKLQEKTINLAKNSEKYYRLGYVQSIDMTPVSKVLNMDDE